MEKTIFKFLDDFDEIKAGTIFTDNEFIRAFGCNAYDDIRDRLCDCTEEERKSGNVWFFYQGMRLAVWDEEISIKTLRAKTKLSQRAFGEFLCIPTRTIENWESNVCEPPSYVVELIYYKLRGEKKL